MSPTNKTNETSRIRAPRYKMNEALLVTSRTIGTGINYQMHTTDISRSGMLLSWRHSVSKVPFRENTLLEMVIDPMGTLFAQPINCIGKVVRKILDHPQENTSADVKFGIQIVQIENNDLTEWDNCINFLSQKAEHLIARNSDFLKKDDGKSKKAG